jgi:hypothetical protein
VKDLFEFLLTALLIGFLRGRQNYGSVSSYNGAPNFGALPSPGARTPRRAQAPRTHARTLALKHALMHPHAAPICAGYSSLAAQRHGLEKQLAEQDLAPAVRASLETDLKAVQAKILKGPEKLKTERAKLQKQLAEQDLAQAVRASLEKQLGAVQTKLSAGGKVLPWFGLGRLLSQLPAHQPFDRAAPSGCVEPECGSSAGRLG